ncbi:MAG: SDR family oxidoreductase, partial [Planctomycetota bacterium]
MNGHQESDRCHLGGRLRTRQRGGQARGRRGGKAVLLDVNEEQGKAAAEALGPAAIFVRTDVSNEAEVNAAVDQAVETFGGVTMCVNCAGILGAGRVLGKEGPMEGDYFARVI